MLELPAAEVQDDDLSVVVVSDRGHRFGLVVDGFLGERDLEVRPLDPRLGKVPNISSASVLDDGWPVLIVDVEDLVRSIDKLLHGRRLKGLRRRRTGVPERRARSGSWSWTTRSPSASSSGSSSRAAGLRGGGRRSTAWTAGTRSAAGTITWSSATSTCRAWTASSWSARSRPTPALKAMPVVIVSYKDREEDRMRGLEAGANCYLTKSSFHDQTFLDTVVDLIGEARG